MAWTTFKLGRPGYEISFDVNPASMSIEESQLAAANRVLSGRRKKWVFRTMFPTVKINTNYFPKTQRDLIASLLSVTDTALSFKTRDDWKMSLEVNPATSSSTVNLQENSATLLSQILVAAGFASTITVTGVFTVADGSGTNYYTGGSYTDSSMTVNLGIALPAQANVYCTYTYTGWAVHMDKISYKAEGGLVDLLSYDISLEGL